MKSSYTIKINTNDIFRKNGLLSLLSEDLDIVEQEPFDAMVVDIDESQLLQPSWFMDSVNILALVSNSKQAKHAFSNGASGILSKEGNPNRILSALQAIENGMTVIETKFIDLLLSDNLLSDNPPEIKHLISEREKEVLALLSTGLGNKQIAERLYISVHTVKFHLNALMRKLGTQNRTETAVMATRMGLI